MFLCVFSPLSREPGMGPTDQSRRIPAAFGICQALPAQLPGNLQLCGDGRELEAGTWPGGEWHTSFRCRAGVCRECSLRGSSLRPYALWFRCSAAFFWVGLPPWSLGRFLQYIVEKDCTVHNGHYSSRCTFGFYECPVHIFQTLSLYGR